MNDVKLSLPKRLPSALFILEKLALTPGIEVGKRASWDESNREKSEAAASLCVSVLLTK